MKRFLGFLLVVSTLMSVSACTADYTEIAREGYELDQGYGVSEYDCAHGLSELADKLGGLYNDDDDVIDLGRDVIEAKVEFDDANLLVGDEYSLPLRIFYYIMADIKTSILADALNVDASGDVVNIYWNSNYPDQNFTIIEGAYSDGLAYCKDFLATFYAMEDYGFEETDDYIYTYENILSTFGFVDAMDEYYAPFGLDGEYLKLYLRYQIAYLQFREYLVGSDGVAAPTDEELYTYFEDECVYMQQIVFPYVEVDELNIWGLKSEEEKLEAKSRGEAVFAEIDGNAEMFVRNMDQSEFKDWRDNVRGYFYTPDEIQQELLDAYYELEVGEIVAVDTPIGYYIIRACDKNESVYEIVEDRVLQNFYEKKHKDLLKPYYDCFTFDEAQFNRYSFDDIITFN